jgi:hypothetical protein
MSGVRISSPAPKGIIMKLETLKKILESTSTDSSGKLTSYGMILRNPSSYNIDYDEIEGIQIFVDQTKFTIALAKLYSEFSNDPDDVFLTYDEIAEKP